LVLSFTFTKEGIYLFQRLYIEDMLQTFGMADYKFNEGANGQSHQTWMN